MRDIRGDNIDLDYAKSGDAEAGCRDHPDQGDSETHPRYRQTIPSLISRLTPITFNASGLIMSRNAVTIVAD